MKRLLALALVTGLVAPPPASAWGERGHDLVTRVAVRLLAAKIAKGTPLAVQFGRKEFMLGHLSNVPDIVWRNQGEAIEKVNAPTHFLDLEYVSPELTFATIPRTPVAALARMKELCAAPPKAYVCAAKEGSSPDESSAGTAPWRAGQLFGMTVESFKASGANGKSDDAAIDRAFLSAGIMSHFIGDLTPQFLVCLDELGDPLRLRSVVARVLGQARQFAQARQRSRRRGGAGASRDDTQHAQRNLGILR